MSNSIPYILMSLQMTKKNFYTYCICCTKHKKKPYKGYQVSMLVVPHCTWRGTTFTFLHTNNFINVFSQIGYKYSLDFKSNFHLFFFISSCSSSWYYYFSLYDRSTGNTAICNAKPNQPYLQYNNGKKKIKSKFINFLSLWHIECIR